MCNFFGRLFFILMVFLLTYPVFAAEKFTVFCNEKNVPVCYRDETGKYVGIDVDIVRELSKRLGFELDIKLVPWKRVLAGVKGGQTDTGMPLFVTKARKKYALYPKLPLHDVVMTAYTKVGSLVTYNDLNDLYGISIGIRRGFSISPEFDQLAKKGKIKVTEVTNIQNLIKMVEANRFDIIIDTQLAVGFFLKQSGIKLKSLGQVSQPGGVYLVVSKAATFKNPQILLNEIDKTLSEMKQQGITQKIINRYIK